MIALPRLQIVSEVSEKDISEAVLLDNLSYEKQYRGNLKDCMEWAKRNPDIYVMVRDLNKGCIVAYVNMIPVSNQCYNDLFQGNLIDVEITPDMILKYDRKGKYKIYFSSIVIHPDYHNSKMFKMMLDAVSKKIFQLAEKGFVIERILADAVNGIGMKLCETVGMRKIGATKHDSFIYEVSLIPPQFRSLSGATKTLFNYYKEISK